MTWRQYKHGTKHFMPISTAHRDNLHSFCAQWLMHLLQMLKGFSVYIITYSPKVRL